MTPGKFLFVFALCFSSFLFGQSDKTEKKIVYREKTGEISGPFDPAFKFSKVNVYPGFSKYSSYLSEQLKSSQDFSYMSDRIIDAASSFLYHPKDEKYMNELFDYRVSKKVNAFERMKRPRMGSADSLVVTEELMRMEKHFRDSAVVHYTASDSLINVLKKYPADNHVFFDVLYFKAKSFSNDEFHHWALVKMFVFDSRNHQLIFYNYYLEYGGKKSGNFVKSDVPKVCFRSIFRKYRAYCLENKKHKEKSSGEKK